jgi:hypothetical protein
MTGQTSVAEQQVPRKPYKRERGEDATAARFVHDAVCSVHCCSVGPSGLCPKCLGEELLDGGWEPLHLLSAEEIARYRASHPAPARDAIQPDRECGQWTLVY